MLSPADLNLAFFLSKKLEFLKVVMTITNVKVSYQDCIAISVLSQSDSDVQKHNQIADKNGDDICVALSFQFILGGSFSTKADGKVTVLGIADIIFHKLDKGFLPSQCFLQFAFVFVVVYNKGDD